MNCLKYIFSTLAVCSFLTLYGAGKPVNISRVASVYGMRGVKSDTQATFSGGGRSLRLELNSRRAWWNGMPVLLGFSVVQNRNGVFVSSSDWESTLSVLFNPGAVRPHRLKVITLDAGHGGNDQGAAGRFSKEKVITLQLTLRVAEILRGCGYIVHLTRNSDTTLPLKNRPVLQRARQSDLFVSIHVNATKGSQASGIETFCLAPADAPSSQGQGKIQRHYSNRFDLNNFLLAYRVQSALVKRTGAVDRGVKRARFVVLRDITAPGILVEIGFISNPSEERLLNSPHYLEKIARGLAEGIVSYHTLIPRRW